MKRTEFIKTAALGTLAAGSLTTACTSDTSTTSDSSSAPVGKKYRWKMVTTWPPNFPVLGEGALLFADWVRDMSGGRMDIKVYGAGELIPALEVFDTVASGAAEMGSGASYYWAGKAPSSQFFTSVPFGMNAQQMNAWINNGGGLALWEELYAGFNLVPMPFGNTGVQMGGWFNKAIERVEDLRGLKMRIPGLGGKVLEKAGGTAVLSAGGEIYTNLERGVIDATEWIGPYHDYRMGFHNIAKYYYYPGWHEPGSTLELIISKLKFEALPPDLQAIIRAGAQHLNAWVLTEFEAKNNAYLQKIRTESSVEVRPFPQEVLQALSGYADTVIQELVAGDAFSKKVYASWSAFRKSAASWSALTEQPYYNQLQQPVRE